MSQRRTPDQPDRHHIPRIEGKVEEGRQVAKELRPQIVCLVDDPCRDDLTGIDQIRNAPFQIAPRLVGVVAAVNHSVSSANSHQTSQEHRLRPWQIIFLRKPNVQLHYAGSAWSGSQDVTARINESELLNFAEIGSNTALMNSSSPFIRESTCLHGTAQSPRHPEMLESVFDEDEDPAIDAVD